MRTKYIGFVKTSFSSPTLPFRIGGYAPEKSSQIPSLLIHRALQLFALAASEKGVKLHSEKVNTRTKGNISSHHFLGSFPALTRFSSLPKEGVHGCAKSRIKSWGEMLNISHFFSFSLRLFPKTTPPIDRFLEEETPNTYENSANTLARETAPVRHSTQNERRHSLPMPVLRTADCPTCVCPPPRSLFRSCTKKTATHLPMDSCLKECGR